MSWAGSANIQDGVTIDLSALNQVNVEPGKLTVGIGPGARWSNVYTTLEPMNFTVAGGRVSSGTLPMFNIYDATRFDS